MFVFHVRGDCVNVYIAVNVGVCDIGNVDVNAGIPNEFFTMNLPNYKLENMDGVPEFVTDKRLSQTLG